MRLLQGAHVMARSRDTYDTLDGLHMCLGKGCKVQAHKVKSLWF